MKTKLMIAVMLLATSVSQAKTLCNVDSGNSKQDMVFGQILFSGEVTTPRYLVIKKGAPSAEEIQFNTFDKWQTIDGATLVSLSRQDDGVFAITVGHVDLQKGKTNALPMEAMALGQVPGQKYLNLIVPPRNLSITCTSDGQ